MFAMDKNHPKVLINRNMFPSVAAGWTMTLKNLIMMVLGAVLELTEKQWRDLLGSVKLRINKTWTSEKET